MAEQTIKMSEIRGKFPMYDDMPDEKLLGALRGKFYADIPMAEFVKRIDFDTARDKLAREVTDEMGTVGRFVAGMGQGASQLGRAVSNAFGGTSQAEIDEAKRLDAPLANTTAGKVGSVTGQIMATAPVAMLPGANTVAGASLYGGLTGALTTEGDAKQRALGSVLGAAGGAGGTMLGRKIGAAVAERAANRPTVLAENAVRNDLIKELQGAGYRLPPSAARPNVLTQTLEGLGGKVLTQQRASQANQVVTNQLARKALGIADDVPLTPETLDGIRRAAGQAYEAVASQGAINVDDAFRNSLAAITAPNAKIATLAPSLVRSEIDDLVQPLISSRTIDSDVAVEVIKRLRSESRSLLKGFDDPAKQAAGRAYKQTADAMESLIERNLVTNGQQDLVRLMKEARTLIAKTHTVEDALNQASGNVSAKTLAKALEKGKPLTGELQTIGKMGQAFGKASQEVDKVGSVNWISPLDVYGSASVAGGASALGIPYAAAALGIPVARATARSAALSGPVQRTLGNLPTTNGLLDAALPLTAEAAKRLLPQMGVLSGSALAD